MMETCSFLPMQWLLLPPDTPTTAPTGTAAATDAATMQPAAIQ